MPTRVLILLARVMAIIGAFVVIIRLVLVSVRAIMFVVGVCRVVQSVVPCVVLSWSRVRWICVPVVVLVP